MKCCYRFPVKWIVEIKGVRPFDFDGWHFSFLQSNGRITQIEVTVPLTASDQLPEFGPNPSDTNAFDLHLNQPVASALLVKRLRTIEGFLSVYGLEKISLDETNISWIPESDEDAKRLKTIDFAFRFKRTETVPIAVPFAVVARSIVAAQSASDLEIPLGFFRKGKNDLFERRYIDAIYDFYFVLETMFSNGKTKNYQVKEEFKKSHSLLSFTQNVLKDGEESLFRRSGRQNLVDAFRRKYASGTPEQFLDNIVELRGFLHHHSGRNARIWNPMVECDYEMDAVLLGDLCFKICSTKVESLICDPP
jgi:hypothetical protein